MWCSRTRFLFGSAGRLARHGVLIDRATAISARHWVAAQARGISVVSVVAVVVALSTLTKPGRPCPTRTECKQISAASEGDSPARPTIDESSAPVKPQPEKRGVVKPKPDEGAGKPAATSPTEAAKTKKSTTGTINVDQEALKSRRIFITGDINDDTAKVIAQQLLYFEQDDPNSPVTIYINSGGGLVHSGLAILDVMACAKMPVATVAYGRCFSVAALLLAAGSPGRRTAYPNARLMVHEPSCSYPKLQVTDILLKAQELDHMRSVLEQLMASRTGRSREDIAAAVGRDRYMSAVEGKEFGLVDVVLEDPRAPSM